MEDIPLTGLCISFTMPGMDGYDVIPLVRVWTDPEGQPWVVVFNLVDIAGRLECVGMEIRSFLALPHEYEDGPGFRAVPGARD